MLKTFCTCYPFLYTRVGVREKFAFFQCTPATDFLSSCHHHYALHLTFLSKVIITCNNNDVFVIYCSNNDKWLLRDFFPLFSTMDTVRYSSEKTKFEFKCRINVMLHTNFKYIYIIQTLFFFYYIISPSDISNNPSFSLTNRVMNYRLCNKSANGLSISRKSTVEYGLASNFVIYSISLSIIPRIIHL